MSDDGSVTKIAANVFLLASAGWGLQIINERPLVGAAFGLYTLKGLLGAMSEGKLSVLSLEKQKTLGPRVAKSTNIA